MPENNQKYYSLNSFFKYKFGQKVIKLSLDGGFTCPNRDGKISRTGCIFCSAKGSGDFAAKRTQSISEQIESQKELLSKKWPKALYIAYFQAFTNTYAPVEVLESKYREAISQKDIVGLDIATRPDCIDENIVNLLKEISKETYVCVELGLQTSNEKTAEIINRGYKNIVFENTVKLLNSAGIDTVCHIILNLPGENYLDMLNSVNFACSCGIKGIKLQMLNILKGTPLENMYLKEPFKLFTLEEYTDAVTDLIEYIPKNVVIHRLTGDGPKDILIEPKWILNKRLVLNTITKKLNEKNIVQGRYSIY